MKKNVSVATARKNFSELLNEAHYAKDRIQIIRNNKPIAYIVPVEDIEILEEIENRIDLKSAIESKKKQTKKVILTGTR